MEEQQFSAIMPYIVGDLAGLIVKNKGISETDAIMMLYGSKLYAMLEREETKLWQYSTDMLYALFEEELESGTITFPDI